MSPSNALSYVQPSFDAKHQPWIRTLETFSIPFFSYCGERRVYTSAAADALMRSSKSGLLLGEQADLAVATTLSARVCALALHPAPPVRELPSRADGMILAVHLVRPEAGMVSAVVIVRPAVQLATAEQTFDCLTPRENEVSRLIASGLSTKAIAFRLGMSAHTARHHTERVFAKLGVRSRSALAALVGGRMAGAPVTAGAQ